MNAQPTIWEQCNAELRRVQAERRREELRAVEAARRALYRRRRRRRIRAAAWFCTAAFLALIFAALFAAVYDAATRAERNRCAADERQHHAELPARALQSPGSALFIPRRGNG